MPLLTWNQWNRAFDDIHNALPLEFVTLKVASTSTGSGLSGTVYKADRLVSANVQREIRQWDELRQTTVIEDRSSVVIWLRDWFGRSLDSAGVGELNTLISDARGQVRADENEMYTRFVVDGTELKYKGHAFLRRPEDAWVYACRFDLSAS